MEGLDGEDGLHRPSQGRDRFTLEYHGKQAPDSYARTQKQNSRIKTTHNIDTAVEHVKRDGLGLFGEGGRLFQIYQQRCQTSCPNLQPLLTGKGHTKAIAMICNLSKQK